MIRSQLSTADNDFLTGTEVPATDADNPIANTCSLDANSYYRTISREITLCLVEMATIHWLKAQGIADKETDCSEAMLDKDWSNLWDKKLDLLKTAHHQWQEEIDTIGDLLVRAFH